jgi:hypothetical protein
MATMSIVNISSVPNFQSGASAQPTKVQPTSAQGRGPRLVISHHSSVSASTKGFVDFRLDTIHQCLWRRGDSGEAERILLNPKPFAILRYLVDHADPRARRNGGGKKRRSARKILSAISGRIQRRASVALVRAA